MKTIITTAVLVIVLAAVLLAAPPNKKEYRPEMSLIIDNEAFINVNRILMFVTNHGNFGRDLTGYFGYDAGTFYPYTSVERIEDGSQSNYVLYASGLWVGCKVGGRTRVIIAEYSDEYVPGPMQDSTFSPDSRDYKVYKLYRDSLANNPNDDYTNWPYDQGAPWALDANGDTIPDMIGDQMLWAVYNDANPAQHSNDAGRTDPLGLEVRQTTFAFDRLGTLGNIIFVRLRVFNKGVDTLKECYFSLWADPDLGGYTDDFVGCDTIRSLGFVYNATDADEQYGAKTPCMGYDFFQGPLIETGNPDDVGRMWGQMWPGYRNLGMVSFNKYINGTDPNKFSETYNYMQGLSKDGEPYVYEGNTLMYMHSGDPTADPPTGDVDVNPADRRWMQSTGPITFSPGDSTEILAAIIVGEGSDRLNSIEVMKELDEFAQIVYENNFNPPRPPAKPNVTVAELNEQVVLSWDDTSEVDPGDFEFVGYTVWQGESEAGPWTELATYDPIDDVYTEALIDSVRDPYSGLILPWVRRALNNDGLNYHYRITQDKIRGGGLRNVTTYYFRVTAFSFAYEYLPNPEEPDSIVRVPNGDRVQESQTVVGVTPQDFLAGVHPAVESADTLVADHISGVSDGQVYPIVLDPRKLTGDTYKVWFAEEDVNNDGFLDTTWFFMNETWDDTLLSSQLNLSGDDVYFTFDGIMTKVIAAAPGVRDWDIPNGTRRFTWAGGASDFHFEGFGGALGWGGPNDNYQGWGANDPVPFTDLPTVLLKLAPVDVDGTFDPDHENVSYAYRYGRNFTADPVHPEFEPYMIDRVSAGYSFQDFEKSCPFSAWNVDVDPPQRLVVGYLENNSDTGLVDGKYWPPFYEYANNTSGGGPREWLWIYLADYSETVNPNYGSTGIDATTDSMPIMYWATWARRADVAWEDGDEFLIIPATVIDPFTDTFTFVGTAPAKVTTEDELDKITVVPNPFYLWGAYDPSPGNYQINFHHLPAECTITIYNLAGEYINQIDKNDPTTSIATWGADTERGLPVSSGIYIYVVDAPGFGQKIGKLAVFMEVEVLKQY